MVDDDHDPRAFRKFHPATFLQGRRVVVVGVVASVVFPLVGVMVGIILLFVKRFGPGVGCISLSVAAGVVWYMLEQSLSAGESWRRSGQGAPPMTAHPQFVASATFHATGVRTRSLPLTADAFLYCREQGGSRLGQCAESAAPRGWASGAKRLVAGPAE